MFVPAYTAESFPLVTHTRRLPVGRPEMTFSQGKYVGVLHDSDVLFRLPYKETYAYELQQDNHESCGLSRDVRQETQNRWCQRAPK